MLVDFKLFVDNEEGAVLSSAAKFRDVHKGDVSSCVDIPWMHSGEPDAVASTADVARRVAAVPHAVHVFAELRAVFTVRPLAPVDLLEHSLMCIPIDDCSRPVSFVWTLRSYVGGLTDRHIAELEDAHERREGCGMDITLQPTALLPTTSTERILVDSPSWQIADAFRV